jgi:hypothetical protein
VQINRRDGDPITGPEKTMRIHAGDGVVVVGRGGQPINALFEASREKMRRPPDVLNGYIGRTPSPAAADRSRSGGIR